MEFLKAILGDELYAQLEQAVNAYNGKPENAQNQVKIANLAGGQYVSKGKYDTLDATNKTNEQKLGEANNLIKQLQREAVPNAEDYQKQIEALTEQIRQVKIDTALQSTMITEGVTDKPFILFKLKEMGEFELDEHGNIKGLADRIVSLKKKYTPYFGGNKKTGKFSGERPLNLDFDYGYTKNDILSMPYTQRVQLYMNDPATYNSIMHRD